MYDSVQECTKTYLETETETEKRERGGTKRATRIPADWKPSEEEIKYCKDNRKDLNPEVVAENFRDYWVSKPGAGATKLDWSATWRSWVRKESAPRTNGFQQAEITTSTHDKVDFKKLRDFEKQLDPVDPYADLKGSR